MQVSINTDRHIDGNNRVKIYFREYLESSLERFADKLTGLEVYLSDENSDKKHVGDDIKCVMEARVKGTNPLAVSNHSDTLEKAVSGAAEKMKSLLETTFDKMRTH